MKKTLVTLALASAAVLAIATPASAHNVVTGTNPADGSTISELPPAYSVTTSEPMLQLGDDAAFAMQVTDVAGEFYGDGCLVVTGDTMSLGATAGQPGVYTVVWQIVSEDGHPESGTFSFTWAPAADVATVGGSATPPVCGDEVGPSATPTTEPSATAAPPAHAHDDTNSTPDIPLSTVLWIGGGVLAVAIAITVLLVARRKSTSTTPPIE
jgi:methionine-rich copper-binding protein CopC